MKKLPLLALCSLALAGFAVADDWPQFRGPNRDGISKETGLLKEWPKEGPPLAWKIKGLGGGYSAPSVAAGRIFGMSYRGADEVVCAIDEKDGKEEVGHPHRLGLQEHRLARPGRPPLHADRGRRSRLRASARPANSSV